MFDIVTSIVTYKDNQNKVSNLLSCLFRVNLKLKIYIVDNSPTNELKKLGNHKEGIEYVFNNKNLGYGKAHNIAIKRSIKSSKYHLVLNPDIYFDKGVLERIFDFMEKKRDIGLLMPKVLYTDGSLQYLCKLLPTPFDLLFRRFLPFKKITEKRNETYELRFTGYDSIMEVPYLSGCFMFFRTEALEKVGLFDERFFLYLEDTDLSRRINKHFKTVYYPETFIYHNHERGSYKSKKLLLFHIASAIKYFNKWGWFFDRERGEINQKTIDNLKRM